MANLEKRFFSLFSEGEEEGKERPIEDRKNGNHFFLFCFHVITMINRE